MAVIVDSTPRKLAQPDGSTFTAVKHGDEYLSWVASPDGSPIARASDGNWYYVSKYVDGRALLSPRAAHLSPPKRKTAPPHQKSASEDDVEGPFDGSQLMRGEHDGNVLIIVVEFTDQPATYYPTVWANRISGVRGDDRSIIDYYNHASYGKVSFAPAAESFGFPDDGVIGPILLDRPHPNTGPTGSTGNRTTHDEIYQEAITIAKDYIDFEAFDVDGNGDGAVDSAELSVVVLMAGYENAYSVATPSTPAHALTFGAIFPVPGTNVAMTGTYAMIGEIADDVSIPGGIRPAPLGVFVHELGHLTFGLPDLYDNNGIIDGESEGVGRFGLMDFGANARDVTIAGSQAGETPVLPTAWSQFKLGWVDATSKFGSGGLTTSARSAPLVGEVQVGIAHLSDRHPLISKFACHAKQYFLMQYRTAEGYDRGLSAVIGESSYTEFDGVVIYHVDERQPNNNSPSAKLLDVEEAGTPYLLPGGLQEAAPHHLWGLGSKTSFGRWSTPNSNAVNSTTFSGVTIETGARNILRSKNGSARSIGISIDSACDS